MVTKYDRIKGAVYASLAGDMLGAPVEFHSEEYIRDTYGRVTDIMPGGYHGWSGHEFTDDGDQILLTLQSIVENKRFDAFDLSKRLVDWKKAKPKDIGKLTRKVLNAFENKEPQNEREMYTIARNVTKDNEETSGNGSLMRALPIALYHHASPTQLTADTIRNSAITHPDLECAYSSYVYNWMISQYLLNRTPHLTELVDTSRPENQNEISEFVGRIKPHDSYKQPATSKGYVVDTLKMGVWSLNYDSLEEGLLKIVSLGEDADTNATIAGGLLGARDGFDAIPKRWVDKIPEEKRAEIDTLIDKLYKLSTD